MLSIGTSTRRPEGEATVSGCDVDNRQTLVTHSYVLVNGTQGVGVAFIDYHCFVSLGIIIRIHESIPIATSKALTASAGAII